MASSVVPGPAGRREERRAQRQDLGRAQLLDAAEEVFGRKGYREATLREVAELAEFSVGSVYSFFDNKDDLFRQIFLRRGQEFGPALRAALDPEAGTPLDQLHRLIDVEVGFLRDHPHFGRVYLRYASAGPLSVDRAIDERVAANYAEWLDLQADLFARGQASGHFRDGDPRVLAQLLTGLVAAYQALDPAVVSDEADPGERFPLAELHVVVERAFRG
jgi:TetR/AcrR family transcriptional regulator